MNKTKKIIVSIVIALVLFVIISNLLPMIIGTARILPCRTAPLLPQYAQLTGPYDKMCYIGQSPLPWIIGGVLMFIEGSVIDYQPVYYTIFWILYCLISAAISILIVWLVMRKK